MAPSTPGSGNKNDLQPVDLSRPNDRDASSTPGFGSKNDPQSVELLRSNDRDALSFPGSSNKNDSQSEVGNKDDDSVSGALSQSKVDKKDDAGNQPLGSQEGLSLRSHQTPLLSLRGTLKLKNYSISGPDASSVRNVSSAGITGGNRSVIAGTGTSWTNLRLAGLYTDLGRQDAFETYVFKKVEVIQNPITEVGKLEADRQRYWDMVIDSLELYLPVTKNERP